MERGNGMTKEQNRQAFCDSLQFAGAVLGTKPQDDLIPGKLAEGSQDEIKKVYTSCRACVANCGAIATVKNGRVIKIEGDPRHPMSQGRLCAKGLSGIQALYNPNRNKYPLVRVGERGENKWKRVSWDEALDLIADKLMDMYEN